MFFKPKFNILAILIASSLLLFFGCKADDAPSASFGDSTIEPLISNKTLTISDINSETATISWEKATKEGVADDTITYQIFYSTDSNIYDLTTTKTNGTAFDFAVPDISQKVLTGLSPSTGYFVNVVATNSASNGAAYSMAAALTTDGSSEVPIETAGAMTFTDSDQNVNEITGTLTIAKAADEESLTGYVIYWGVSAGNKLSGQPAIGEILKADADLTYNFVANTPLPNQAAYFVVFTKNEKGEMTTGSSVAITDVSTPGLATSVTFTDIDLDLTHIQGTVNVGKATDEADIDDYRLYWGSDSSTKLGGSGATPITIMAKTGSDLSYSFPVNTVISSGATHLLIFTKNASSPELTTPTTTAIVDVALPSNAAASVSFTDTDKHQGEIGGAVTITKATDESIITDYVLYWGQNSSTKLTNTAALATLPVGGILTHNIPANTIPEGSHLLVYTKNIHGEMATGVNILITDRVAPLNNAQAICFTDGQGGGNIAGVVTITLAAIETDLTAYNLYWSNDGVTKISPIIATLAQGAGTTIYTVPAKTVPVGTHFVVMTSNAVGEADTGVGSAPLDGAACP